ncbi:MAG: hypothetical protein ACPG40_09670, partial [Alphaproteobacteria bacterium]
VRVSLVWLKDENEDLAATMKSLDQALAEAERWANSVEGRGLGQFKDRLKDMADRARAARPGGGQRYRSDDHSDATDPTLDDAPKAG